MTFNLAYQETQDALRKLSQEHEELLRGYRAYHGIIRAAKDALGDSLPVSQGDNLAAKIIALEQRNALESAENASIRIRRITELENEVRKAKDLNAELLKQREHSQSPRTYRTYGGAVTLDRLLADSHPTSKDLATHIGDLLRENAELTKKNKELWERCGAEHFEQLERDSAELKKWEPRAGCRAVVLIDGKVHRGTLMATCHEGMFDFWLRTEGTGAGSGWGFLIKRKNIVGLTYREPAIQMDEADYPGGRAKCGDRVRCLKKGSGARYTGRLVANPGMPGDFLLQLPASKYVSVTREEIKEILEEAP